jgi:hypothetical protein
MALTIQEDAVVVLALVGAEEPLLALRELKVFKVFKALAMALRELRVFKEPLDRAPKERQELREQRALKESKDVRE